MRPGSALLALVLVAVVLATTFLGTTGSARAAGLQLPYGFRTPDGSFVIPYYQGFTSDVSLTPGALVFGDAIDIEFVNELGNRTIEVSSWQNGTGAGLPSLWLNQSFYVLGNTISVLPTFNLPSTRITLPTQLCVDGGCVSFLHQTPLTIFPEGILTYGGLDLIAFGVTIEFLILAAAFTLIGYALTKRALWTPKIAWWLIIPHLMTGLLFVFASDVPLLDESLGGLEFVLVPIVFALLWFFWVMHLFNSATPVEADQISPRVDQRPGVTKWWLIVGTLPDGRWIIVGTRWRDWLARLFGHAPVIYDPTHPGEKSAIPATLPVLNRKAGVPDAVWNPNSHHWERFRPETGRETPFASFPVTPVRVPGIDAAPRRELPLLQFWVDHDQWLSIRMPYVSWWREEKVEAEYNPDGTLRRRARIRRRLTAPHYVDPSCATGLSSVHFEEPVAAWLGYLAQERAYKRVDELRRQVYALITGIYVLADEQTRRSLGEVMELLERERFPMPLDEAAEEVQRGGPDDPSRSRDELNRPEQPEEPTPPRGRERGSAA